MKHKIVLFLLFSALFASMAIDASAQEERSHIRSGNKLYESGKYTEAEVDYRRAMETNAASYEARFNLGDAMYKQQRYDEAEKIFSELTGAAAPNTETAAKCHYNLGNSMMGQRKLKEAIEAYKNSLRINPKDMEAKFNLAFAQKLLEEDQNKDQNKDQNQDQNQDQNKDQNQDQNQDQDKNKDQNKDQDENKDKNQDNKDQNKDQNQNNDQNKDQNKDGQAPPPPQGGMSKAEADKMLNAVQANEDKTKEKVDEKKAQAVGVQSGKNW